MFFLEVEGKTGYRIKLTQNEGNFQISKIDGILPPKADIVTTTIAGVDGGRYKSSKIDMRNIVIHITVKGDVEKNRILLYEVFDNGELCTIYFQNGTRNVFCIGYCEDVNGDLFSINQTIQVSILCPDPFWKELSESVFDLSFQKGNFTFPFSIDSKGIEFSAYVANRETKVVNIGDVTSGLIITMNAVGGTVANPAIYNVQTGEAFKVNTTLSNGNELVINTNVGSRGAWKNGSSVFKNIADGASWLKVNRGGNTFTYNADSGVEFLTVKVSFNPKYKGV